MLKRFLKTTKGKVTAICSGVALVAVVAAVAVMLILNNNKYRSISVADVKGIVNVIGQKNNGQAYKGQRLFDGDDVSVMEDSELTLCLNNDKYVYADENTHFKLEASSSKQGNKLKIVLDKGSELNVLTAKLGDGDTYQVDTPNSTMSVRGTRFRMTVYTGDDGYTYTLLEVESGIVLAQLKTLTGDYNGVEKEFFAGQSALIRGGDDFSEFVLSEDNAEVWLLDYKSLPSEAVPRLIELLKEGEKLEAAAKEAEEKAVTDTDEKDKNQVAEKDPDKDKEADKETDADKDKEKEADKDSKDGKDKDSKDGKDKDAKDNKDSKDNKETANNDNNSNVNNDNNGGNNNNENNNNNNQQQTTHTHTWTEVIDKQPTCGEEGSKHLECSCGEKQAAVAIPATGNHSWTEVIDKDATCAATGIKHEECSVCHAKQNEGTVIAATGKHSWTEVIDKNPTCAATGIKHEECSVCHVKQNEGTVIAATGKHTWEEKSRTEPTCTAAGTSHQECKNCPATQDLTLGALGHDWSEWIIVNDSTCNTDGVKYRYCKRCNPSATAGAGGGYESAIIPADASKHNWVELTRTNNGSYDTVVHQCSNCFLEETYEEYH